MQFFASDGERFKVLCKHKKICLDKALQKNFFSWFSWIGPYTDLNLHGCFD
jgi:hypothetical protein